MNWNSTANWQRWDGSTWVSNPSQGYPGQNAGTGTVTIRNGHTVTLNLDIVTNPIGNLIVGGGTSGQLTLGNGGANDDLTVSGNVTVNAGATIATADDGLFTIGGNLINNNVFDMNIGTDDYNVIFNGTANQTISGTGGTTDFNVITINNTGAANDNIVEVMPSNFTAIAGFLTLTQGIIKMSGTYTFTNTFFSTAAPTINSDEGIWLNNPNVTVTAQNGDTDLSGLLRITDGTYNVGASADWWFLYDVGAIVTIEGGAFNIGSAFAANNPASSTVTYTQSGGIVTANIFGNTGAFGGIPSFGIETAGSVFNMSGGSIVLQRLNDAYADFYNIAGTSSVTGGTVQVGNASSPVPAFSYWVYSTTPIYNLLINDVNSPTAELRTNTTVINDVTISTGAGLDASTLNSNLTVGRHFINDGLFTQQAATVTFNGNALQTVSGATTTTFYNLTANNTAGNTTTGITLNRSAIVTNSLTLTSGHITTSTANILTMNAGSTVAGSNFATRVSGGSDNSFVNGPMVKTGNTDFLFPVGKINAGHRYAGISGLSAGTDSYRTEFIRASGAALGTITASGLNHVSNCEYWAINQVSGTSAHITLSWSGNSNCNAAAYVNDLATLVAAHFGTSWDSYGNSGGTTGTVSAGSVTWNSVSTFSPFALGSTSGLTNPLPITLINLKGYRSGNVNKLEWTNMTESDIALYEIQRSANGIYYETITTLSAIANNSGRQDYIATDEQPLVESFYRIKVTGNNGRTTYSAVVRVVENVKQAFTIYPNPVSGRQFALQFTGQAGTYSLRMFNAGGQMVKTETIQHAGGSISRTVDLPVSLPSGQYFLLIAGGENSMSQKLIIQ